MDSTPIWFHTKQYTIRLVNVVNVKWIYEDDSVVGANMVLINGYVICLGEEDAHRLICIVGFVPGTGTAVLGGD